MFELRLAPEHLHMLFCVWVLRWLDPLLNPFFFISTTLELFTCQKHSGDECLVAEEKERIRMFKAFQ